jgi:hypothetical protein
MTKPVRLDVINNFYDQVGAGTLRKGRSAMKLFYVGMLLFVLVASGCATTYRDFPVNALATKPAAGTCDVMHYNVKKFDVLDVGGYSELQTFFRDAEVCRRMVPVDEKPKKGLYVEVETHWKPITMPALVFGYLSVSTLTLLPAWSTKDGYVVKYSVYVDEKKMESYRYEITRTAGLWLGLLPFAWINLLTYNEEDAFKATSNQFVIDARQYLTSPGL